MKIKHVAVGILSLALVLGLWSYSKAEGNEITVCAKKGGFMYVIGAGFKKSDCKKNDQLLTWNVAGLKGDKGDKGDTGPAGPQGPKGDKGDAGENGIQGEIGPIGPQGPVGNQGINGISGYEKITAYSAIGDNSRVTVTATCPEGKKVISGGFAYNGVYTDYGGSRFFVRANGPSTESSWTTIVHQFDGNAGWGISVDAICVSAL